MDIRRSISLLSALLSLIALAAPRVRAADPPLPFVWIEGEKPVSVTGVPKWQAAGWGHKELLSGDAWLQISVDENKTTTDIAPDGAIVRYEFTAPQLANYEVWDRIGYEFVRSPFEWRIDGGAWQTIQPDQLTADLETIDTWNEVAWLKLGDAASLAAGPHALEIRLTRRKKPDGSPDRVLYASDALCLTAGHFFPNGKYPPGAEQNSSDDKRAAETVFSPPSPPIMGGATRSSVKLSGLWQVCRADEQLPGPVAQPFLEMPEHPFWTAIPVPSDKNESRPDLLFAHRLWYRTKFTVPTATAGRSFLLTFPQNCLNTTVVVNGVLCGFNKNPHAAFTVDITKGVRPGQTNELRVGIRDAWYGYSASPTDPMKLRRKFNMPMSVVNSGFQDLSYPVWHAFQSGILVAPTLTVAGGAYASDVFVQPSVAAKSLTVAVTVGNDSSPAGQIHVECQALDATTGKVGWTQSGKSAVGSNTIVLSSPWPSPTLWWPDAPHLYTLRTTVFIDNKPVDVSDTPFGFREWGSRGKDFTLNGIVWHGWADLNSGDNVADWLKAYRASNQRFTRLSGYSQGGQTWLGMTYADALDWCDREGVVVRRCGTLDGEAIGYMAIENDPDLKKLYHSDTKVELQDNWRDQMVQQVIAERNHPSIQLWSLENEWLYINCINLYGGYMDEFEARAKSVSVAVRAVDPTRLTMTDGGSANKDNGMPVHGNHYVYSNDERYPALAYEANPDGGGRGRWTWDQKRPRYLGEDYFANGINPADFAWIGGEATFQGKASTRAAAGLIQKMLTEGYRWAGYGAYQFWLGSESATDQYGANAPVAAFCKEWDSTFGSGQHVPRTIGLFNDSFHETHPLTFEWTLASAGKTLARGTVTKAVLLGASTIFPVQLPMPAVPPGERRDLIWTLTVMAGGQTLYAETKPISVLGKPVMPNKATVLVYDPSHSIDRYLRESGVVIRSIPALAALPQDAPAGSVLVIGRDALTAAESATSALSAWASAGRTVIVLEQKNPLRYQALAAPMESTSDTGRIAFADDLGHPALRGLAQSDFFTWGAHQIVYRSAYKKPASGGRSLIQCDARLEDTALAELPTGKGLLLLSQLCIAETIDHNAVAQRLLGNLISYGAAYRQRFRPVSATVSAGSPLAQALADTGVRFSGADTVLAPLTDGKTLLAVVEATPANLYVLSQNLPAVDRFTARGGYLVLCGLTPDGLADYNRVVGVNHMIRPFRRERVTFPATRNRLTAGLALGDVVLQSGQRLNDFTSDTYAAGDTFSYAVDYDEIERFAKLPEPSFWGNTSSDNDKNPYNMVSGFSSADGWQYTFSIWAGSGDPKLIPFEFAVPQAVSRFEWEGTSFYWPTTRVEITFDGKRPIGFATEPNSDPQTFAVASPAPAKEIGIRIAGWEKRGATPIVGIDNIRLWAKRSPEFYAKVRPLLSIGTLMEYPRGPGGIVLENIQFQQNEERPENGAKKRRILATILRNLDAPFGGAQTVLAGANLNYTPIEIGKQANTYRNEKGWFGDPNFTFSALPTGEHTFAGVRYRVYDFATSPVPTAIRIGAGATDAVRGIPVQRKADALFFLQAARIDRRRSADEIRDNKRYELAHYVIHYTDGQVVVVPVDAETDVDDYKQGGTPSAIPGAQIAWTRPYPGTPFTAVAYTRQWTNSRPEVSIESVDLESAVDPRGSLALLALTAAQTSPKNQ